MTPHDELIEEHKDEINKIIASWLPADENAAKKTHEVSAWLKNFRPSEFELALKLLKKIQYYSDHDIKELSLLKIEWVNSR